MEFVGMPVVVLPKERYRYRPRTGECFHLEFAFRTGKIDFRTGRHIPDYPNQPEIQKVWSRYDQR